MSEEALTFRPDYASPPGNTLRDVLSELGMTQTELAARAGWSEKFVSQVVNGKAPISPDTALLLERILGTPASFWMNREAHYREALARADDLKRLEREAEVADRFPYNEMVKLGWVERTRDPVERLSNLLRFFGVDSLSRMDAQPAAVFRVGKCSNPSDCALIAWLQAGRLQAQEIRTGRLDREAIRQALPVFRGLTREEPGAAVERVGELLADAGVALALTPALPKTAAHGATHWVSADKAVLQLSDRYKRADVFWFSFFHEVGHLLRHAKGPRVYAYVNREERGDDPKEEEADRFAADTLIPPAPLSTFVESGRFDPAAVRRFADEIDVHADIVVGRLQHQGLIGHHQLRALHRRFDLSQAERRIACEPR